jgi:hypothetical protein
MLKSKIFNPGNSWVISMTFLVTVFKKGIFWSSVNFEGIYLFLLLSMMYWVNYLLPYCRVLCVIRKLYLTPSGDNSNWSGAPIRHWILFIHCCL